MSTPHRARSSTPTHQHPHTFCVCWRGGEGRVRVRFILKQLTMMQFSPYQPGIIIGLLLSDDSLTIPAKRSKNVRVRFKQYADHASYVLFVFNILSHY